MKTEIEQEECNAKWNGTGFGVWGSERGLGTGNMKQTNIGNMKCVGERDQEWGYCFGTHETIGVQKVHVITKEF